MGLELGSPRSELQISEQDGEEVYIMVGGVVLGESGCQSGNGIEHRGGYM